MKLMKERDFVWKKKKQDKSHQKFTLSIARKKVLWSEESKIKLLKLTAKTV